ncbi:hypothetical protein [Streptomyces triticirhizae]|uniref:Uncharacterized protein n=1 Tax=Streptomyces triticirhizae TaxID=2483353 RepID=A0A3M2M3S8_9ACTN|nr:hypothetical protein [Streptomyces triticirhizae]RMI44434.1 hypothetical protein EBN88_05385 [Streptomyces triticirhizae]
MPAAQPNGAEAVHHPLHWSGPYRKNRQHTLEAHVEDDVPTIAPALPVNRADRLFATRAVHTVPGMADRYEYKKEAGSSDTQHSYDTMKV